MKPRDVAVPVMLLVNLVTPFVLKIRGAPPWVTAAVGALGTLMVLHAMATRSEP